MLQSSSSSRSKKLQRPVSNSLKMMRASKRSPQLRIRENLLQLLLLTPHPDRMNQNLNRSRTKSQRKLRKNPELQPRKADLRDLKESKRVVDRREKRVVEEAEARTTNNLFIARKMLLQLNQQRTSQLMMKIRKRARPKPTPSLTKFLKLKSQSWKMLKRKSKLDHRDVDKRKLSLLPLTKSKIQLMMKMLRLLHKLLNSLHSVCQTWQAWDSLWLV